MSAQSKEIHAHKSKGFVSETEMEIIGFMKGQVMKKSILLLAIALITTSAKAVEFVTISKDATKIAVKLRFEVPSNGVKPIVGVLVCDSPTSSMQIAELDANSELSLDLGDVDSHCNYAVSFGVLSNYYVRNVKTFFSVKYTNGEGHNIETETLISPYLHIFSGGYTEQDTSFMFDY